ncbi:hypothetical protein [Leptolyngbya sp. FACHB-711]|uniref:hypothetical protein n=1 Tax=Leptolyngbya sp. FACHB-711 TaxID=2692813 RepID=UPI001684699B|nr:hypothetical protein [Leptolyngbya sp. FACHB-711]MBD2025269.1 hypothetical protein [Leptolyngbya sp. FACHB-711]
MNQSLNPKGLSVRAAVKGNCLQLLVQSPTPPEQQKIVSFIARGLNKLAPQGITTVKVCGQQIGEDIPAWIEEIQLGFAPPVPPISPPASASAAPPFESSSQPQQINRDMPHSQKSEDDPVRCPHCTSTQIGANKKGFSGGKAIAGAVLLGPLGLATGLWGARKVQLTCLKCGFQWKAGKTTPKQNHAPIHKPIYKPSQKPKPVKAKVERANLVVKVLIGIGVGVVVAWVITILSGALTHGGVGPIFLVSISISGLLAAFLKEFVLFLAGNCPYCGNDVHIPHIGIPIDCPHCNNQIRTEYDSAKNTAWFHPIIK